MIYFRVGKINGSSSKAWLMSDVLPIRRARLLLSASNGYYKTNHVPAEFFEFVFSVIEFHTLILYYFRRFYYCNKNMQQSSITKIFDHFRSFYPPGYRIFRFSCTPSERPSVLRGRKQELFLPVERFHELV